MQGNIKWTINNSCGQFKFGNLGSWKKVLSLGLRTIFCCFSLLYIFFHYIFYIKLRTTYNSFSTLK